MAQTHVLESTASTKDPWKELVSDGRVRQLMWLVSVTTWEHTQRALANFAI